MTKQSIFAGSVVLLILTFLFFRFSDVRSERNASIPEALKALDLWTMSRAYPNPDIPADGYFRAYLDAKNIRREHEALSSVPAPWLSIGPTNFAGRTISIAINPLNPNTIYIGAASGGLWRSRTGGLGADWQRVATGFPVLGVNAIAIQATDTTTMYIGTGEVYRYNGSTGGIVIRATRGSYGMGILKTVNGGITWTKSLDWTYDQKRGVQIIRINPLNPQTVLAATSEGVYRSTNAGGTWTQVLNALLAQDIAINPADTTKVLATCGNFASSGAGVYRSTDGGGSFALVSGLPTFTAKAMLEIYASNPWSVYANLADTSVGSSSTGTGSLWKSTDFGVTWTQLSGEALYGVQGWYSQFVAVHPMDSTKVVRGAQYLYKSTNGGTSSFRIADLGTPWADYHNYAHHPADPNILYIVDDGGVWRSTDFGSTYQDINTGLRTSQFYNGFSCSAQDSNRALGQVQDHFGWMYTGSLTWPSSAVDEIGWTAINQSNDFMMYAGNRGGGSLSKSTNRGVSFFGSSSGIPGGAYVSAWNTPFILSNSNPNVLYFGRSTIYKTTNAGANWAATNGGVALDGNPSLSMAVAPTSPDTVFVGTVPGTERVHIFRTTNGGTSWTNMTGDLPNRYPLDIMIDPRDSRVVYVAFGGFDTTRLAKSTDAGLTWTHISSPLPNVPTTAVAIDPFNTNHIYVGDDLGVFVSTDGGASWASFNDGLFEAVTVADLVISPSNRSIRLASHSNGVFTRKTLSTLPTGVEERQGMPEQFVLHQNFPNPFNPTTRIPYSLSKREHVTLKVYDIAGHEISTLIDRNEESGLYFAEFNASRLASGVYFYGLQVGGRLVDARKALLMR
jgi:photosystem II stability/assembly factor-like uncharacterized protein